MEKSDRTNLKTEVDRIFHISTDRETYRFPRPIMYQLDEMIYWLDKMINWLEKMILFINLPMIRTKMVKDMQPFNISWMK